MYRRFQSPRQVHHHLWIVLAIISAILLASCSTTPATGVPTPAVPPVSTPTLHPAATSAPKPTPTSPSTARTVFLILMENHNWSDIKNSPSAPYINDTLLPMASYAEQYYNPPGIHPSEPNYLWLEAGTNFGIFNDAPPSANHQNTALHLVTLLGRAGLSWKSYQEGISGTVCPLTGNGLYAPKHNPMVFFDDVTNTNDAHSSYCIAHIRPYHELATDLQQQTGARYNFITPNLCDDMHDSCAPLRNSVAQGDTWLSNEFPKILNSNAYKNGGALFITWDEAATGDGPIGMILVSAFGKGGGDSNSIHYTHGSTLRTFEEIFGVAPIRDAANETDLSDLFQTTVSPPAPPTGLTATPGDT